jgi:hypothetical protein
MSTVKSQITSIITNPLLSKCEKLSDILKIVIDLCGINNNKYMIIASYGIRFYRPINDLDMNMESDEWMKLQKIVHLGIGIFETYNQQQRYFLDMTKEYQSVDPTEKDFSIEIFRKEVGEGYPDSRFSIASLLKNKGLERDENKHLYFNKNTLLRWKRISNRPKDQNDIILLENLIRRRKKHNTKRCPNGKRRNQKTKKCEPRLN